MDLTLIECYYSSDIFNNISSIHIHLKKKKKKVWVIFFFLKKKTIWKTFYLSEITKFHSRICVSIWSLLPKCCAIFFSPLKISFCLKRKCFYKLLEAWRKKKKLKCNILIRAAIVTCKTILKSCME